MQMVVTLLLMLAIYSSLNVYLGSRLLFYFRLSFSPFFQGLFWLALFFLAFSYIFGMLLPGSLIGKACRYVGSYWMVMFLYLLLGFILMDGLRLLGRLPFLASLAGSLPAFTLLLVGTLVVCGSLAMVSYGAYHARQIGLTQYQAESVKSGPPGQLRIALVSDLHLGSAVDNAWLSRIVAKINEARPDVVCIAGDIFDNNLDSLKDVEGIIAAFRQIEAPYGTYACLGNHDVEGISFRDRQSDPADEVSIVEDDGSSGNDRSAAGQLSSNEPQFSKISQTLEAGGITLLLDEMVLVEDMFYIAGRKDASPIGLFNHSRLTVDELTAARDKSLPLILLDHQPGDIPAAVAGGVDLLLSGHTHRGQVFPGNLVTQRLFLVDYGHKKLENTNVVVSSGAGVWGPPIRVGTNSEVAVIDLKWYTE